MGQRYIAFDLETAKVLPESVVDLLDHRPLGIACAAAVATGREDAIVWHGLAAGKPSAQMSREEVRAMVSDLAAWVQDGYTLVSWNGLAFDFNILAEESNRPEECANLALVHVDMMFHAVCKLGHYVSLAKAAEALGIPGKASSMSGSDAPMMWAEGQHEKVLGYNVQDARLTLRVAEESERRGQLTWVTRRGTTRSMPLERGWQCVGEACHIPLPDTSWMSDPPTRERALNWLPPSCRP